MSIVRIYHADNGCDCVEIIYTQEVRAIRLSGITGGVTRIDTTGGKHEIVLETPAHVRHSPGTLAAQMLRAGALDPDQVSFKALGGVSYEFTRSQRDQLLRDLDHWAWPDELVITWRLTPVRELPEHAGDSYPTHVWTRKEEGAR